MKTSADFPYTSLKKYKITHKNGRVIYSNNLTALGKSYGCESGFHRV